MTTKIQAGRLNRQVVLQTVTKTPDLIGGYSEAWADTATVWARVEAVSGNESFQAMQVNANQMYRVTIRKRDVTPEQRLKYGTAFLNIRNVSPDEQNEFLELLTEQVNV